MQSKLQLKMQLKLGLDMELSKQIPRPTRRLFIARMPQVRFKGLFKNTLLLRLALRTKFNMQLSTYQRTAWCWVLLPLQESLLGLNSIHFLPIHVVSHFLFQGSKKNNFPRFTAIINHWFMAGWYIS